MPRTTLPKTSPRGSNPTAANPVSTLVFTAADVTNGNEIVFNEPMYVFIHNSGASPFTYTIDSAPNRSGREADTLINARSLAAGAIEVFGPVEFDGWEQGGKLLVNANNVAIRFAVIPANFR